MSFLIKREFLRTRFTIGIKKGAVPTLQNIIKICEAMEISLEQFFCGGNYRYTDEENAILKEWFALSDLEKDTILNLMETFKILKTNK